MGGHLVGEATWCLVEDLLETLTTVTQCIGSTTESVGGADVSMFLESNLKWRCLNGVYSGMYVGYIVKNFFFKTHHD